MKLIKIDFSKFNQESGVLWREDLVSKIAEAFGESWPVARSHEKIGIYAGKSFEEIREIRGIGTKKARGALQYLDFAQSNRMIEQEEPATKAVNYHQKLASLPLSYVSIPDWSYENYLKWVDPKSTRQRLRSKTPLQTGGNIIIYTSSVKRTPKVYIQFPNP